MIYPIVFIVVSLFCFRQWFFQGFISSGDLWPVVEQSIRGFQLFPSAWSSVLGGGLGASSIPYLWNHFQYAIPIFFYGKLLHLSWEYIVRFGYLFPFLILSVISSYRLGRKIVGPLFSWLSAVIYTTNTYILLVISGGQTGVAMAYASAPVVFEAFMSDSKMTKRKIVWNTILTTILIGLDLRIAYLVFGAVMLFLVLQFLIHHASFKTAIRDFFLRLGIPCVFSMFFHAYWILPSIIYRSAVTDVGSMYTDPGMLTFLSFADFSHAISLLHPNWPENLFGKVYFLQPEFLVFPVIAFASFVFGIKNGKEKVNVFYFGLLAIIGTFFAKGVNLPFGGFFTWSFDHIPGFILFRDPTKFYLYIAVAYSVLIPYTLKQLISRMKIPRLYTYVIPIVFLCFWGFTIRQAITGNIKGTLQHAVVAPEYTQLETQLSGDTTYYRTLWIPSVQRFAYPSSNHPAVDAMAASSESSISGVLAWLESPDARDQLSRWSVRYVIVPIDTAGELFLTDRKYDDGVRQKSIKKIDEIPWLRRETDFVSLAVWKTPNSKSHAWIEGGADLPLKRINDATYTVESVDVTAGQEIIFSERYNPLWKMQLGTTTLRSVWTNDNLNKFIIPVSYVGPARFIFSAQKSVTIGLVIGSITAVILMGVMLYEKAKK